MNNTFLRLLCGLILCTASAEVMHAQANTPPWNGNLTVLGFTDLSQGSYVAPFPQVSSDPSGSCPNAAAVVMSTASVSLWGCIGGNWSKLSGSGGGGGFYQFVQSNGGFLPQRVTLNVNFPLSAVDNASLQRTDLAISQSSSTSSGYLSSSDWTTFNNKQTAGNYLTDPGNNGVLVRSSINTTRLATAADISPLLANIFTNGTATGIGPASFSPAATLAVFDNTASTGSTLLNLKEGVAQSASGILQILDNANTVQGNIGISSGSPSWLLFAPSNIATFGSYSIEAHGDTNARLGIGLDSGAGYIGFGTGAAASDVGLERSAANTLTVTQGGAPTSKGNLVLNNITINGSCLGAGCPAATSAITQITGDIAAGPGPGSVASVLATVNSGPGLCGDATHVCQVTTNGKGLVTVQASVPITGGGGGGASLATQLLDFAPGTITSTSIPFGASCSSSTPCYVYLGGTQYPFTNGVTLTKTAGTANDTVFYYVDGTGKRTMGYNSANTYTCTNCENSPQNAVTAFPATSYPLYSCTVSAGAFSSTSCTDQREILAFTPVQNGQGTSIVQSGSVKQFNAVENPRAVTLTSDTLSNTDCQGLVTYNNANPVAVAIPQAGLGGQFLTGCAIDAYNYGVGTVTITPAGTSKIGGATTLSIPTGAGFRIVSDGANYQIWGGGGSGGGAFNGGTITNPLTINDSTASSASMLMLQKQSSNFNTAVDFLSGTQSWRLVSDGTGSSAPGVFNIFDVTASAAAISVKPTTDLVTITKAFAVGVNTITFSATPVFDFSKGNFQTITLTGNVTSSTAINLTAGQTGIIQICQDATGGRPFVAPTTVKGFMTIGTTASKCSVQAFASFDGTNLYATGAGVINQ